MWLDLITIDGEAYKLDPRTIVSLCDGFAAFSLDNNFEILECFEGRYVFTKPQISRLQKKGFVKSTIWDDPDLCQAIFSWDHAPEINFLAEFFKINCASNPNILDVGCGYGRLLIPLLQQGYRIDGLDENNRLLYHLKKEIEKGRFQYEPRLFCTKSEKISFLETYDAVFSAMNTIRYLLYKENIACHFSNISQSLKENGVYLLNVSFSTHLLRGMKRHVQTIPNKWNIGNYEASWSFEYYNYIDETFLESVEVTRKGKGFFAEKQLQADVNFKNLKQMAQKSRLELLNIWDCEFEPVDEANLSEGTHWIAFKKV